MNLLLEMRGMMKALHQKVTTKIDALSSTIDSIKLEIKEEISERITATESNVAVHDDRLDTVEVAVRQLRNDAEAATKANDLSFHFIHRLLA
jgi:hypothetical protein